MASQGHQLANLALQGHRLATQWPFKAINWQLNGLARPLSDR
jgi:hypothetical protein